MHSAGASTHQVNPPHPLVSQVNLFRAPAYRLVPGEEHDADDDDDEDFHILELEDMERLQSSLDSSGAAGPWDSAHRLGRDRATSFEITLTDQSRLLRIDHIQQVLALQKHLRQ